jgi:hypothetical protein
MINAIGIAESTAYVSRISMKKYNGRNGISFLLWMSNEVSM